MFCMGNPDRKLPEDIIHLYSDDYIVTRRPPLTDREHAELMDTLDFYKEQNEKNGQSWAILFLCVTNYTKTVLFDTLEITKEQYIIQISKKKRNRPHISAK